MRQIVVSVPHTGTRTLKRHLGLDHYEHLFTNREDLLGDTDFFAHIPVRHPMDVARSWASRNKTHRPDPIATMLDAYTMLFRFIECRPHELHRIEDITIRVGAHEQMPGDHADRVAKFQAAMTEHVILQHHEFFAKFYP